MTDLEEVPCNCGNGPGGVCNDTACTGRSVPSMYQDLPDVHPESPAATESLAQNGLAKVLGVVEHPDQTRKGGLHG